MGKAFVIEGLDVINPLCTVTLVKSPLKAALKEYYSRNTSINETEKIALENFVQSLIDTNLWDKMKYFYPMLGNNVSDCTLEVISPNTEDLISNVPNTGLFVNNRMLIANNRPASANYVVSDRIKGIDTTKIGVIGVGESAEWMNGTTLVKFGSSGNYAGMEMATISSGYGYPTFTVGNMAKNERATNTLLYRILCGTIENSKVNLYLDTELEASADYATPTTFVNSYGVLSNQREKDYKYHFMAITEGFTKTDWDTYYPLLVKFLKAVGKHL